MGKDLGVRLDRHSVEAERRAQVLRNRDEGSLEVGLRHEEGRLVQDLGIVLAVLGFLRASPLARRERAGNHRRDEKEREREELLRVRDDELMRRRHEEPVECQEGEDARHDRRDPPERDRHDEHGDEVEHRDVRDLRALHHETDQGSRDRDGGRGGEIRDQTPHQTTIVHHRVLVAASVTPGIASPAATLVKAAASRATAFGRSSCISPRKAGIALDPPV